MGDFTTNFNAGTHLISTATVFGACALAFAMLPFGVVMIRGLMKAKDNTTSGFSILNVVLLAFVVHFVFCMLFITVIKILDVTNLNEANFYSQKIFKIFWANSRGAVLALVGGGATNDALGAYSTLLMVQTVGRIVFYNMPFLVLIVGFGYGAMQAVKDNYKQDYLTVLSFSVISFICVSIIYIVWAYIASEALFIPDKKNLFDIISQYWQKQLTN